RQAVDRPMTPPPMIRRSDVGFAELIAMLFYEHGDFLVGEHFLGGDHGDAVPGADLRAQLAPDAAVHVDRADAHGVAGMLRVVDFVDAIDGTDGDAGFTAGADVLVQNGQLFGSLFRHTHFAARTESVPRRR